jgi:hypothetical protein
MLLEASDSVMERRAAVLVSFIFSFTPSLPLAYVISLHQFQAAIGIFYGDT